MSASKPSTGSFSESSGSENTKSNTDLKPSADCNKQSNFNIKSDDHKVSVGDTNELATPDIKLDDGKSVIQNAVSDSNYICQEFNQKLTLDFKKHFTKCRTFPVSTESQQSIVRGTPTFSRSITLPSSSTLVSALKGGRALSGIPVKAELSVKWDPEVYDPPTTSMSHTLNSHNQRPKSKKKDKRKNKGKASRKTWTEQKHSNRKSYNKAPEPLNVRLHGNSEGGKSKGVDLYEYGGYNNNQEVKCGSSFLMESLPKVHLSIGEAS